MARKKAVEKKEAVSVKAEAEAKAPLTPEKKDTTAAKAEVVPSKRGEVAVVAEKPASVKAPAPAKKETAPVKETAPAKKETAPVKAAASAKKATAAKKEAAPAPAKKPAAKKAAVKTSLYIQYGGKEYDSAEVTEKVKAAWVALGNKITDIKSMDIYMKPEESAVYYVINEEPAGKVEL